MASNQDNPGKVAAFTPGPWVSSRLNWRNEIDDDLRFICGQNERGHYTGVCIVEGNRTSQVITEANARLIAASPSLFSALTNLVALVMSGDATKEEAEGFWADAIAALAIAEGGAL